MLTFKDVSLRRDGRDVLRLDLELTTPGITVVMGPNGAGKSLFLQVAHGLIAPDAGSVTWQGVPAEKSKRSRGYVFQSTPILRRSVRENLRFPLSVAGQSDTGQVEKALGLARLQEMADTPAAVLSGGELGRMALARALILEPSVVLMDEPGAALDPGATKALEAMVRDVSDQGVKVIMTTHDLGQARRLADDVLFFDAGRLNEAGPAARFFEQPQSAAARRYLRGEL